MYDPIEDLARDLQELETLEDLERKNNKMKQAVIQDVQTKEGPNWFQYRFKLDGETYGVFADRGEYDEFEIGDKVEFESVQKGKYNNITKMKLVKKGTKEEKKALETERDYVNERIFYSGVQKPAIELVVGMIEHDLVSLPQKKADKMDAVLSLAEEVTQRLANQVNKMAGKPEESNKEEVDGIKE